MSTKHFSRRIGLCLSMILGVCLMFSLIGCGKTGQVMDGDGMVYKPAYAHISQDEAKLMMQEDDGHVIVDVRRANEYAEGHIPGAILIPNESITDTPPEELPDKYQTILVYCRTGRRSKEASQKLADMGYVNVYEFGGIEDWTGEIVQEEANDPSDEEKARLSFESFDGGGPEFQVVVVEERSPIADNLDHKYKVTVDDELNVQLEQLSVKDINEETGEELLGNGDVELTLE